MSIRVHCFHRNEHWSLLETWWRGQCIYYMHLLAACVRCTRQDRYALVDLFYSVHVAFSTISILPHIIASIHLCMVVLTHFQKRCVLRILVKIVSVLVSFDKLLWLHKKGAQKVWHKVAYICLHILSEQTFFKGIIICYLYDLVTMCIVRCDEFPALSVCFHAETAENAGIEMWKSICVNALWPVFRAHVHVDGGFSRNGIVDINRKV